MFTDRVYRAVKKKWRGMFDLILNIYLVYVLFTSFNQKTETSHHSVSGLGVLSVISHFHSKAQVYLITQTQQSVSCSFFLIPHQTTLCTELHIFWASCLRRCTLRSLIKICYIKPTLSGSLFFTEFYSFPPWQSNNNNNNNNNTNNFGSVL